MCLPLLGLIHLRENKIPDTLCVRHFIIYKNMTNHTDRKVCLGSSELRAEGEADFACGEKPQKESRVDISLPLYFG